MKQVPVPYFVELLHEAKISEWGSMGGRRKGKNWENYRVDRILVHYYGSCPVIAKLLLVHVYP